MATRNYLLPRLALAGFFATRRAALFAGAFLAGFAGFTAAGGFTTAAGFTTGAGFTTAAGFLAAGFAASDLADEGDADASWLIRTRSNPSAVGRYVQSSATETLLASPSRRAASYA